ncbi:MerR family transcriptional regulator [Amphibacillus cookii]|uniref:MerR family transcriptional regulator n=1 Tax=Amphibacillus cookii TaxID=767787 RepID=UPI001959B2B4|nr:MerR family transcriptional regulator [Amphibacillus cookii]MBM7541944.1 DNA-binding transcriptional MerR regulator [Amphibacillus cookii]
MQLKAVLEETQLTKKAIRYYEDCGLLRTVRKNNGYKDYSQENIEQLKSIKKLRNLGFSIDEIKSFYQSETAKQDVIIRKINQNEKLLNQLYQKKELLSALHDSKDIQAIPYGALEVPQETPYMYLRNIYRIFGTINLISFVMIIFYFLLIREHVPQNIGMLLMFQSALVALSIGLQHRRSSLKKQGIHILERKPKEIIFQYLSNLFTYGLSGAIINEMLYFVRLYVGDGQLFLAFGNMGLGLFFLLLSAFIVVLSFFEDDFDLSVNTFNKRITKSEIS